MLSKNKAISKYKITTILDVLYIKGFDHCSPRDTKVKKRMKFNCVQTVLTPIH